MRLTEEGVDNLAWAGLFTVSLVPLILLLCSLAGCDGGKPSHPASDPAEKRIIPVPGVTGAKAEPRFHVESFGTFEAGFRSAEREILVITDTSTGRQFLGITGVGVSELRVQTTVRTHTDSEGHLTVTTSEEIKEQ